MMENKTNFETTQTVQLPEAASAAITARTAAFIGIRMTVTAMAASIAAIIAPTTTRVSARAA